MNIKKGYYGIILTKSFGGEILEKKQLQYLTITRNWGGTKVRQFFDNKIAEWILQFEESERELVLELLKHFKYYTSRSLSNRSMTLYKKLIEDYNENPNEITFIPVYKEYGVGFSDEFFNKFWMSNNLYDSSERDVYKLLKSDIIPQKIAILDDYSGSGKTIRNTIQRCIEENDKCLNTLFYIITIQMSNTAKDEILNYADDQKIIVRIIYLILHNKAFENEKIFNKDISQIRQEEYCKICSKAKVNMDYYLGFEKTQALLSFEYNTPNNTLGLFWYEGDDYFSIFKRHKKESTGLSKIQKEAKKRRIERRNLSSKNNTEDRKYKLLMCHLIKEDYLFNYHDACNKFGMSEEQMDEAIGYLLINKYVSMSEGRIKPTEKLKKLMVVTKISDIDVSDLKEDKKQFETSVSYVPRNFQKCFNGYKK